MHGLGCFGCDGVVAPVDRSGICGIGIRFVTAGLDARTAVSVGRLATGILDTPENAGPVPDFHAKDYFLNLYAEMNGFSGQRVKGTVKSVLLYDEIIRVSLSLYDTDGLEGLYVPRSTFNETAKDVASGAMGSNMTINQGSYGNSLSQWGMQAIQNAYQRTTSAVGKAIRRNSATLKYGTFVYLVNGRETRTE